MKRTKREECSEGNETKPTFLFLIIGYLFSIVQILVSYGIVLFSYVPNSKMTSVSEEDGMLGT